MKFYLMGLKEGWESPLSEYARFNSVANFYNEFNFLMKRSDVEKGLLLKSIKP